MAVDDLLGLPMCDGYIGVRIIVDVASRFSRVLQSDNATTFKNTIVKSLLELTNCDQRFSTPYNPQGNSIAEASVKRLITSIRKELDGSPGDWVSLLSVIEIKLNSTVSDFHGSTPIAVMFARTMTEFVNYNNLPEDNLKPDADMLNNRVLEMRNVVRDALKEKIEEVLAKRAKYYSNGRLIKNDDLFPGTAVLLYDNDASAKLDPKYYGPFNIVRKNRGGALCLKGLVCQLLYLLMIHNIANQTSRANYSYAMHVHCTHMT
eukprot:Nk52_evm5s2309 gene=Nk52_evmTU5s2309